MKMKQSGTTITFVIVCIAVLLAAYGVGLGIRTIRFGAAEAQAAATTEPEKPADEPEDKDVVAKSDPEAETLDGPEVSPAQEEGESPDEERPGPGRMAGMRERFQNMSEEERREAMAQMRERSGGGRRGEGRGGFSQLSEEDRENLRAEMEELGARADEMSEEEMRQARNEIMEKYGITPRRFDGGEGGRRRSGGIQEENN